MRRLDVTVLYQLPQCGRTSWTPASVLQPPCALYSRSLDSVLLPGWLQRALSAGAGGSGLRAVFAASRGTQRVTEIIHSYPFLSILIHSYLIHSDPCVSILILLTPNEPAALPCPALPCRLSGISLLATGGPVPSGRSRASAFGCRASGLFWQKLEDDLPGCK